MRLDATALGKPFQDRKVLITDIVSETESPGLKTGVKNDICGSGFGEPGDHQEFTGIPPGAGTPAGSYVT